ncbi:O-antigen ligase family protein [Candidatus Peregrinibacteria bacterium]|nr:O-antigen ligase family protein [Candidatus Peregrinibacteria bacterium]
MKLNPGKLRFATLAKFFFYTFVFFLPFNINLIIYTAPVFSTGIFNPYSSFFIYIADFFLIFALLFWAVAIFKKEYNEEIRYGNPFVFMLLILLVVAAEISVFFARDNILAILTVIRLFEFGIVYFIIQNKIVSLQTVINVFIASVSLQALIAIMQFLLQGSLNLQFLGESVVSPQTYGAAKMAVADDAVMRPYGTFPHTNILAGYLVMAILFTFYKLLKKETIVFPLLLLQIGALILTFSRTALLALIIAWFIYISVKNTKIPYKLILLILTCILLFIVVFNLENLIYSRLIFNDISNLNERVFYFNLGKAILFAAPFGIGIGNFTLVMQNFTNAKIAPWDFQPVHNIYMLMVNEIGIPGLVVFSAAIITFGIYLFRKIKKTHSFQKQLNVILLCSLGAYIVLGMFDHYLFSLYQGLVLTFLLFGIYGRSLTEENH